MKSARTRPLAAALLSVAMTAGVLGGAAGTASAAYDPSAPPYPADPDNATTLTVYDVATGAVVDHGDSTKPLSAYYFVAKTDFSPNHNKAALSGFLAEAGKAPGSWSGSLLGPATTYPVANHDTPTAVGGSTDSFDSLAGSYPNTAPSTSDFYQLYQLRVRTTFPTPASSSYAFGDLRINPTAHTWQLVNPAPASAPPTTATRPGAPTGVTARAGDGTATVSFTAPGNNGGSPVTSYLVTASTGQQLTSTDGSPVTVTGLSNGTSRTFTVTASNAAGTSDASAASNPVIFSTTRLTASVTSAMDAGSMLTLSGQLTGGPVASRPVVATVYTAGHGSRTLTLTTGSTGLYSTSFRADYDTAVSVAYAATSTQTSSSSSLVRTAVRTLVKITTPTSGTRTRVRTLAVNGTTSPNKAGQYVALYERRGAGYVKLAVVRVGSTGGYHFSRTFTKATHVLQVRIAAVTNNSPGNSNVVTLYEV